MNHAKYVGRVGGLAIALGVGLAVASAPGIASAETSESQSGSSAGTTSQESESGDTQSDGGGTAAGTLRSTDETDDDADVDVDEPEESVELDDGDQVEDGDEPEDSGELDDSAEPEVGDELDDPNQDDDTADIAPASMVTAVEVTEPAPEPAPELPAPAAIPMALAALSATRDESERTASRASATVATAAAVEVPADPSPNVLVIGVDGTNLSRVLADLANTNFFGLMQDGTTAPASIAGHTTISNPSWTSILTGAWGEKTGVVNNVFTPWTYDDWPTVFTQLESFNPGISTTSIANWNVISAIAGAGSIGADEIVDIAQIDGDTDWLLTDDAVGDATELAIMAADPTVPNFVFSYFVGVDENGHLYGGASPQYAEAIRNADRNLGEILQAIGDWEAANNEQWTILVVTDHGHQPQKGLGHGFQSPDETATFVIAENPNLFASGAINLRYQIVDITPTVLTLFGGSLAPDSDGVPLTTLDDGNVFPIDDDAALRGALQDTIAKYGYPDIGTNLALGLRTIATTVPYLVYGLTDTLTAGLQSIAEQDIFLISPLAALAIVPVRLIGNLTYVVTNVVAQIVARLTGVTGASIFPLWPPAPPSFETPEDSAVLCDGAAAQTTAAACGQIAV